jgi:hypothetical protein
MSTKAIERPVTAKRPVQPGQGKDSPGLPGLAEALEIYRRIAQVGGVRPPRAARRRPSSAAGPAGLSG